MDGVPRDRHGPGKIGGGVNAFRLAEGRAAVCGGEDLRLAKPSAARFAT